MSDSNLPAIRGVLWDLDGTLVDSEEFHWLAWKQTMEAEGVPVTYDDFVYTFGWRNDAILPRWLGERATPAEMTRIADAKEECYRALVRGGGLVALPGAAEWVARLRDAGWKQSIASSAPRANVVAVLEAIGLQFDAMVGAEDVVHGKPAPDVFLAAAAKLGADPANCVVVEDADAGVEAGRRAGAHTIGISRGGKARAAHLVVGCLTEIPLDAFDTLLHG